MAAAGSPQFMVDRTPAFDRKFKKKKRKKRDKK